MSNELYINEQIQSTQVKLIIDDKLIGIVSLKDALYKARERDLDLVLITEGEIPTCKLLNADRYRYEKSKSDRESARRQRELTIETKEIQLRPVTGEADLLMKARKAKVFLDAGDKVKLILRFRGREKTHKDEGRRVIEQFLNQVGDHKIDRPLMENESDFMMILASNVTKSARSKTKIKETI